VLALLDRVREVRGAEVRRRREDHDVDAAVDDLLVGVEAEEALVRLHADAVALLGQGLDQPREAPVHPVREDVAHRGQVHVAVGREQRVRRRAGPAPAAADEPDPDRVRRDRRDRRRQDRRRRLLDRGSDRRPLAAQDERRRRGRRRAQELPPVHRRRAGGIRELRSASLHRSIAFPGSRALSGVSRRSVIGARKGRERPR
jgi:hypothetical protein